MRPDEFFEQRWRAERDELWARVGGGKPSSDGRSAGQTSVVLESGREVDSEQAPSFARKVELSALAAGWAVRVVRSIAAVPRTGLLTVVTVRCARHDERLWASWWNGHFECAQYLRSGSAIERLGWRTVAARRGVMDAINGVRLQ